MRQTSTSLFQCLVYDFRHDSVLGIHSFDLNLRNAGETCVKGCNMLPEEMASLCDHCVAVFGRRPKGLDVEPLLGYA